MVTRKEFFSSSATTSGKDSEKDGIQQIQNHNRNISDDGGKGMYRSGRFTVAGSGTCGKSETIRVPNGGIQPQAIVDAKGSCT